MKKRIFALLLAALWGLGTSLASAATVDRFEWQARSSASSSVDGLTGSNLGSYTFSFKTAGTHFGGLYLDYELNEPVNTFANEYGATGGSAGSGLSWEIDEPGFDLDNPGDIFGNFFNDQLDGMIFNGQFSGPQDVAMALLFNFTLGADETADLTFTVGLTRPDDVFYLAQYDGPDGEEPLYFYANLVRHSGDEPVPEPSTILLLGAGVAGLALYRRRSRS